MINKQTITVNINLDGLRGELRRSLQRIIYLVAAGLQITDKIADENLQLPINSLKMTYDPNLKYTSDEIKQQYHAWIVTNGFRDSIESVSTFLESAHQVLSFWKLGGTQNQERKEVRQAEWNDIVVKGAKTFHRLGFPDKLEHKKKIMALI